MAHSRRPHLIAVELSYSVQEITSDAETVMSEGRSSPATLQEQRRPTRDHINLLHEIVLRAQQDPLVNSSPKDALLNAYSTTFEEHHLDVLQDSICFWTLLKVIDPGAPSGSLYEKFENVLKDEGIELSFDDDVSQIGTAASTIASASPVKIGIRRRRPDSQPAQSVTQSPFAESWQRRASLASQPTTASQPQDDYDDYDDFMDNPPAHIAELTRIAEAMDRRTLIRQSLAVLQPRGVAAMEAHADIIHHGKLKDRVVHQWRSITIDQQRDFAFTDTYYEKKLKRRCLRKILDAARIQRIKAMDEERLKGMALYKMTLASREAQFRRKVDTKLKVKYLARLVVSCRRSQAHQSELDIILERKSAEKDVRLLKPAVEAMVQAGRRVSALDAMASNLHEKKAKRMAVTKWYDETRNIVQMQTTADEARRHFLMRKYMHKFQIAAAAKRNRRIVIGRWVLSRWRNYLDAKKHEVYDTSYRHMRKVVKMNLARGLLQKWADQTRQLQKMEERADQMYADKVRRTVHRAIVSMYERSQQVQGLEKMATTHADRIAMKHAMSALNSKKEQVSQLDEVAARIQTLHSQQVAAQCLKRLSMKSFEIRRRERDAEAFRTRHDKKLVRSTWEKMRIVVAQSRGEEPLRLPPATPAQRRAEEINRLTSTTPKYTPASRLSFAARLRGDNAEVDRGEIPSKITEEGDDDTSMTGER